MYEFTLAVHTVELRQTYDFSYAQWWIASWTCAGTLYWSHLGPVTVRRPRGR